MTSSEEKKTPIPAVPLQPRSKSQQSKPRVPSGGSQNRYPSTRRSGNGHGHSHSQGRNSNGGRQQQRRKQAVDQYNKYLNLAKEAASSGDDVMVETHYQHAEHYYRVMNPEPVA